MISTHLGFRPFAPRPAPRLPRLLLAGMALLSLLLAAFSAAAQSPPKLVSITPAVGATNAAPRESIVFEFDQTMEPVPLVAALPGVVPGNYQFTPANVASSIFGSWSPDRRTLTFKPGSAIPLNTTVTWTLNPAGAGLPIKSATGQALATVTGSYKIASSSGGNPAETCPPITPAPGSYTVLKFVQYLQNSALDPVPNAANSASFSVQVLSPPAGPAVTGGSMTIPGGTVRTLLNQVGAFRSFLSYATETAMDGANPAGQYVLRFNQTGEPERAIALDLPASPAVVPKIENYSEAQAIDATRDFTLRWTTFSPQGPGAIVRLVITDEFANRIFLAPNSCVPRTLDPTATSLTIPAGYLRPGFQYQAQLIFGLNFYSSTTDVAGMNGNAFVQRSTLFQLKAAPGTPPPPDELCTQGNPTLGSYVVTKLFGHRQVSASEVLPQESNPALFSFSIQPPPTGPAVTNGSLTLPDGSTQEATNQFAYLGLFRTYATETALETAYPEGAYTVRFTQVPDSARLAAMTMPATPGSIPRIVNFDEAQTIDPTRDFTLKWDPFSPQGPGAFVSLIVTDDRGKLTFLAPNPCIPRTLDPTATSIAIPSRNLAPGVNYQGTLVFGLTFHNSTNDVPQMAGYGVVQRSTSFQFKTAGGKTPDPDPTPPAPAVFTAFGVLASGRPEFRLTGTAGSVYSIQRTASLTTPDWRTRGSVTMDASGSATYEDPDPALTLPAFYRAKGD